MSFVRRGSTSLRLFTALAVLLAQVGSLAHLALDGHALGAEGNLIELRAHEGAEASHQHAGLCETTQGLVGEGQGELFCSAAMVLRAPVLLGTVQRLTVAPVSAVSVLEAHASTLAPLAPLVVAPKASPPV